MSDDKSKSGGKLTIKDKDGNDIAIGDGSAIDITFDPTVTTDFTWSTDSIITTTTPSGGSWITDYIGIPGINPVKEKCSKCKKVEEVHTTYNWSDDDKLKRTICKKCHTAAMDKMYGLDNNIKAEEALYGKKDDNK